MAIDVVVEEVADNLEETASALRRINTNSVGFFLGGLVVGAAAGFYFGYKYNKEKIKAEAFKQSEEEVARIRETYQQKVVAATPKPSLEEVVEEQGYDRPLRAPVPGLVEPKPPNLVYDGGKDKNDGWDFSRELEGRTDGEPYIIHQDEFHGNETNYDQVSYTYYAADDVLVDDANDQPLPHADIVVGVNNLRFGHGADDVDAVFVRNDRIQLDMEISRTMDSFEEKVLGLENSDLDDESHED